MLLILSVILSFSVTYGKGWKEVRYNDEVIVIRKADNKIRDGQPFAMKGKTTFILIGDDLGKTGEIAIADLQRYLPLASDCQIKSTTESSTNGLQRGFTILLATTKSSMSLILTEFIVEVPGLCPFIKYKIFSFMVSVQ